MAESSPAGQLPVTAALVRVSLFWAGGADVPAVDAGAVLLMADGKVASGSDLVYRDQPRHVSGSVTHAGKSTSTLTGGTCFDVIDANLAGLPPTIERIAVVATADGDLHRVPELRVVLADLATGTVFGEVPLAAAAGTALVAGELRRSAGSWEFHADGRPRPDGPAGLARALGLPGDALGPVAARPPADEPTAAPPPSFAAALPAVPAPPPPLPVPVPAPRRTPGGAPPAGLRRGERVLLADPSGGPVNRVRVELAWEPAPGRASVDLDPAVLVFDADGAPLGTVLPAHPDGFAGAVHYAGSAQGEGAVGTAEPILVDLLHLPDRVGALVLAITSASPDRLADVRRAACYVSDDVGHRLAGYEMTDLGAGTALLMAVLRRVGASRWQVQALGDAAHPQIPAELMATAARHARAH